MTNVTTFPARSGPVAPFEPFSPAEWEGQDAPPYSWMVDGCFLRSTVSILSGDGGLGKSLLMQQLLTCASIGKPWLGLDTKQVKTFGFFCEDDKDELHRRQQNICRLYGCSPGDLENVAYYSRVGMENVLMEFDRRTDKPQPTPLFDQLREHVLENGYQLIVLDTLADVFAGNEIIRNQVRRFVTALRKIAVEVQGSIIMTAHPSNTGMSSGTGNSGSTAWNNSVRSRLYLTRTKRPNEDGEEEEPNERFLRTMKNNQGPWGGKIRLRWENGVFIRMDGGGYGQPSGAVDRIEVDGLLVEELGNLIRSGHLVAADGAARTGFANILRNTTKCKHMTFQTVMSAQNRLVEKGRLALIEMGPPSKRVVYIRPADMRYPREKNGETE